MTIEERMPSGQVSKNQVIGVPSCMPVNCGGAMTLFHGSSLYRDQFITRAGSLLLNFIEITESASSVLGAMLSTNIFAVITLLLAKTRAYYIPENYVAPVAETPQYLYRLSEHADELSGYSYGTSDLHGARSNVIFKTGPEAADLFRNQASSLSKLIDSITSRSSIPKPMDTKIPGIPIQKPIDTRIPGGPIPEPVETMIPESPIPRPIQTTIPGSSMPKPIESMIPGSSIPRPLETVVPGSSIPKPLETVVPGSSIPKPLETVVPGSSIPKPIETVRPVAYIPQPVGTVIPGSLIHNGNANQAQVSYQQLSLFQPHASLLHNNLYHTLAATIYNRQYSSPFTVYEHHGNPYVYNPYVDLYNPDQPSRTSYHQAIANLFYPRTVYPITNSVENGDIESNESSATDEENFQQNIRISNNTIDSELSADVSTISEHSQNMTEEVPVMSNNTVIKSEEVSTTETSVGTGNEEMKSVDKGLTVSMEQSTDVSSTVPSKDE